MLFSWTKDNLKKKITDQLDTNVRLSLLLSIWQTKPKGKTGLKTRKQTNGQEMCKQTNRRKKKDSEKIKLEQDFPKKP